MHMAIIFYGFAACGSLILSILYMNKYWTDEKFEKISRIENEDNRNDDGGG